MASVSGIFFEAESSLPWPGDIPTDSTADGWFRCWVVQLPGSAFALPVVA